MLLRLSVTASEELHLALKQRSRAILPLFHMRLNCGGAPWAALSLKRRFCSILFSKNRGRILRKKSRIWFDAWFRASLVFLVEYLGRFLVFDSLKSALQRRFRDSAAQGAPLQLSDEWEVG